MQKSLVNPSRIILFIRSVSTDLMKTSFGHFGFCGNRSAVVENFTAGFGWLCACFIWFYVTDSIAVVCKRQVHDKYMYY